MSEAIHSEVLTANRAFYQAFRSEDPAAMDALWAKSEPVVCIHPGWDALRGRDDVMESWRAIFNGGGAPQIDAENETVHLLGADVAFVICIERAAGAPGQLVATNVFRREDGVFRLCHHQAGLIANASVAARERDPQPDPKKTAPPKKLSN